MDVRTLHPGQREDETNAKRKRRTCDNSLSCDLNMNLAKLANLLLVLQSSKICEILLLIVVKFIKVPATIIII